MCDVVLGFGNIGWASHQLLQDWVHNSTWLQGAVGGSEVTVSMAESDSTLCSSTPIAEISPFVSPGEIKSNINISKQANMAITMYSSTAMPRFIQTEGEQKQIMVNQSIKSIKNVEVL